MISAKKLRSILRYDRETGAFTWLVQSSSKTPVGSMAGSRRKDGRVQINIEQRLYFAHRLAWLWVTGRWPAAMIDHVNCDPSDNRWDNLREATDRQNKANMRTSRNSVLGVKGVRFHDGKYEAHITVDYKQLYLGRFDTAEQAQRRYFEEAKRRHGPFARMA